MQSIWPLYIGIIYLNLFLQVQSSFPYYGTKIGTLKPLHHGVSGDVYAVDSRTIFVKNFNYDGEAPAAYFYVGNTKKPSNESGLRLRDERGGTAALTNRYRNKDITLSLPEGKTLRDLRWFSVWCDEFAVSFGDVSIPNNIDFPKPQKIPQLKGVHSVSSDNIVVVDAQTILVPNFSYDGEAPDAKFWVGRGQRPTPQGLRIPDENGKEDPLRKYDRKTIVLTLPGDLTIFDIGHFGVWCEAFTVDFGHVRVPEGLNVPPSLKMLGISPQSKLNCEVLYDDLAFEVRWAVAGESIVVQLVAKLAPNEYMSFGISPSKEKSQMIGADVVVAWVDKESGKGYAQDYFLDDKSQCSGDRGVCPDVNILDQSNSIRLLNAAMVNSYSIVTYQRSLTATDNLDLPIYINGSQAIVWAIGPLNQRKECSFHTYFNKQIQKINFGRQPSWNCPMPPENKVAESTMRRETEASSEEKDNYEEEFYDFSPQAPQHQNNNRRPENTQLNQRNVPTPKPTNSESAWVIPPIQCYEPEDGVFYAQMGPTGGKHGYAAITGHVGWGISWYINGLLIPEIHVVRGKTYTFVIEGGNNPDIPAKYHPFYITDDPVGGYEHKREEEKKSVKIFAGVQRNRSGHVTSFGVGRLCNWTPDVDGPNVDDYQSFGAYQRTLTLKCDRGEPGVITWTPDHNTPDTVYYQCFTHRYLGWKIQVHDRCDDSRFAASDQHETRLPATSLDLQGQESKVSTNVNILLKHPNDLIKNHNMNGTPPKLSFEITKSTEITKLISDGIRAAEALEESLKYENNEAIPNPQKNINRNINNQIQGHPAVMRTRNNSLPLKVPIAQQNNIFGKQQLSQLYTHLSAMKEPLNTDLLSSIHHNNIYNNNKHSLNTNSLLSSNMHAKSPNHHIYSQNNQYFVLNHANNLTKLLVKQNPNTIGLSEYLLPPQNTPLFRPVKLPARRPLPSAINKFPQIIPILPQQTPKKYQHHTLPDAVQFHATGSEPYPSVVIKQYRKPITTFLRTFTSDKKFPIEPIAASVLLLDEPIQLDGGSIKYNKYPTKHETFSHVPYTDVPPKKRKTMVDEKLVAAKNPLELPTKNLNEGLIKAFYMKNVSSNSDLSLSDIASLKPAINNGFKPDSVIIESGFRPIISSTNIAPLEVLGKQIAKRRKDPPGSDIDEAMEANTIFLTAKNSAPTQNFEPMFIPSPPDIRKTAPIDTHKSSFYFPESEKLVNNTKHFVDAKVRNDNFNVATQSQIVIVPENLNNATEVILNQQTKLGLTEGDKNYEQDIESYERDSNFELEDDFEKFDIPAQNDEKGVSDYNDEQVMAPAEKVNTFYLPPNNRKITNTDLPSGTLITYDGKSVIDTSLVLPPKIELGVNHSSASARTFKAFNDGWSKSEQLRNTPQFKTFQGTTPKSIKNLFAGNEYKSALISFPNLNVQSSNFSVPQFLLGKNMSSRLNINLFHTTKNISTEQIYRNDS